MKIIQSKSYKQAGWSFMDVAPLDSERYPPKDGCEGPIRMRNGKVVYYCEGEYYDADRNNDIPLSQEEIADFEDVAKHSGLPGTSFDVDAIKARSIVGPKWGILQREGTVRANYNTLPATVTKSSRDGFYTVSIDKRDNVLAASKKKKGRCWKGYEPVPGKEPYSDGSCKPKK